MQLGMIGLGRMGTSMVRRLMKGGHECVVHDLHAEAIRTCRMRAPSEHLRSKTWSPGWPNRVRSG